MRWLASVVIVLVFLGAAAVGCRVWDELLGQGQHGLYIIDLDGSGLRRLTGGDAGFLGWLEDNVALTKRQGELQALDTDSGEVRTLVSARFVMYRLSPDRQRIAYLALPGATLHVAKVDGSEDRILAEGGGLNWLSWSPDNQRLVYNLDPDSRNYVVSVSGDEPARYVAEGAFPDWEPCERILVDEGMWLYSIDPDGNGRTLLGEIAGRLCNPNGDILALEHHGPPRFIELLAVDGSGSLGTLTNGRLAGGSWSPDGSKLAVFRDDGERTLVIVDIETRAEVELVSTSFEKGSCWSVCWSPDSEWVAFSAGKVKDLVHDKRLSNSSDWDLYVARPDGSEVRKLLDTPRWEYGCGWTPDGTRIMLLSTGPPEDGD
jgi:Tol biopolymer transport system component